MESRQCGSIIQTFFITSMRFTLPPSLGTVVKGQDAFLVMNQMPSTDKASLTSNQAAEIERQNRAAWKYMASLFLLIALVFWGLWHLLARDEAVRTSCSGGWEPTIIVKKDTCWKIATSARTTTDELKMMNPGLDCDYLIPGEHICVPGGLV